jgi:heme A synthase
VNVIVTRLKNEPAVLIGLLSSLAVLVVQIVNGDLTAAAAVPLVAGVLTRFLVTPTPKDAPT